MKANEKIKIALKSANIVLNFMRIISNNRYEGLESPIAEIDGAKRHESIEYSLRGVNGHESRPVQGTGTGYVL